MFCTILNLGVSNVLRSLKLLSGDGILYNNMTYSSMKSAMESLVKRTPGRLCNSISNVIYITMLLSDVGGFIDSG